VGQFPCPARSMSRETASEWRNVREAHFLLRDYCGGQLSSWPDRRARFNDDKATRRIEPSSCSRHRRLGDRFPIRALWLLPSLLWLQHRNRQEDELVRIRNRQLTAKDLLKSVSRAPIRDDVLPSGLVGGGVKALDVSICA
jgi:hypothetical protein